ncbi:hypothetical protein [Aureimonas sp. N4]|uniref:hypothetical protein n=1 Tax=Aureimonas sp. N4 TaxID=1638165 RepID=UPI0012E35899|nr:hypothetical protein [Aureimonas sp. N4]
MEERSIFGTTLHGKIDDLNNGPELLNIGLAFRYDAKSLWIEDGPRSGANLANRLGVGEAISRHIAFGGISL